MNKLATVAVVVCIFGMLAFSVKGQDEDETEVSNFTEESDDSTRDARKIGKCSKEVCTKNLGTDYYCSKYGYCRKYGKRGKSKKERDVNDEIDYVSEDGSQTTGEVDEPV